MAKLRLSQVHAHVLCLQLVGTNLTKAEEVALSLELSCPGVGDPTRACSPGRAAISGWLDLSSLILG